MIQRESINRMSASSTTTQQSIQRNKLTLNKIHLQSKANHSRVCIFSYVRLTYLFLSPLPWVTDLYIRTWPSYSENVPRCPAYQKWSF